MVFENQILPELIEARKSGEGLRIWSAACSSGEEPFAGDPDPPLAGVPDGLRIGDPTRHRHHRWSWRCRPRLRGATDYALRNHPPLMKQRYFKPERRFWELDPRCA